jgi:hypothetical protein
MRARDLALIALVMVATVIFLPLLMPAGFLVAAVEKRRRRKAARSFPCVRCGRLLGPESVDLADKAWREHVQELLRLHPYTKFRLLQTCHAICPACGTRYTYRETERTFAVETPRPSKGVGAGMANPEPQLD